MNRATSKQRQVLIAYLRRGSYKEAAAELDINENTARTRIGHMLKVNGWNSIAQAAFHLGRGDL